MIEAVAHSGNYQLACKLLDATTLRQEAIATNIANADTPGFRRIDVSKDFAAALRARLGQGTPASAAELAALTPRLVEDTSARSVRPDGNSVELESELLALGRNGVEHDFLAQVVTGHIKQLRLAITGRVT